MSYNDFVYECLSLYIHKEMQHYEYDISKYNMRKKRKDNIRRCIYRCINSLLHLALIFVDIAFDVAYKCKK